MFPYAGQTEIGCAGHRRQGFDWHLENLLFKQYPHSAGLSETDCIALFKLLCNGAAQLEADHVNATTGHIPFVIMVKNELVSTETAMARLGVKNQPGISSMHPMHPDQLSLIASVTIPNSQAHLPDGTDRDHATLNIAPQQALEIIQNAKRSPLTLVSFS